jgi:hypothetical protein
MSMGGKQPQSSLVKLFRFPCMASLHQSFDPLTILLRLTHLKKLAATSLVLVLVKQPSAFGLVQMPFQPSFRQA